MAYENGDLQADDWTVAELENINQEMEDERNSGNGSLERPGAEPIVKFERSTPKPPRTVAPKKKKRTRKPLDAMVRWHDAIEKICRHLIAIEKREKKEELAASIPELKRHCVTLFNIRRNALRHYERFPNQSPKDVLLAFQAGLSRAHNLVGRALRHRLLHGVVYSEGIASELEFSGPACYEFFLSGTYDGWNALCSFSGTISVDSEGVPNLRAYCEEPFTPATVVSEGERLLKEVCTDSLDFFICMDRDWSKIAPGQEYMVRGTTHLFQNPYLANSFD